MRKTYKAHTLLSITVNLGNGYYRHISFDSNSNGTSTYSTNDEDIQKAMEKHPKFGKYFTVENEPEKPQPLPAKEPELLHAVEVDSLSEAKQYLIDQFEVSRTKIRTRDDIISIGKEKGIEFTGI